MKITYQNKNLGIGNGYDKRRNFAGTYGIVIHTTNGKKNTLFEREVKFLRESPYVAAHYIISKSGTIVEILPIQWRAWHAGAVNDVQYNNNNSIGIELHYTPGENKDLPAMYSAAQELCRYLASKYKIHGIKMHREIAIPKGRKIDPSCFTDKEFAEWRSITLFERKQCLIRDGATVWTAPDKIHPIATHINDLNIVNGVVIKSFTTECAQLSHNWFWVTNGIGFIERNFIMY